MSKAKAKNRSILLAIGAFLLSNLKWLIGLLKLSKFGATFLSMAISLAAYAWVYGWKFAAALVYLIFVHELGHLVAAKQKGLKTSPAIFLPFVGAVVSLKELPKDARTEAYLAYGGPFAGLLSFLPAVPLYWWTHDPFWGLVIHLGALINLFNLLPISPLDGGRIVSVLSTKIWMIGLIAVAVLLIVSPSPMLFLIFLFGLFSWWNRVREGYQARVLSHEKQKWLQFIHELKTWPTMYSFAAKRMELQTEIVEAEVLAKQGGWLIPFLQDERRFARDKARIDYDMARTKRDLLVQWERTPVSFLNGDPLQPVTSPILAEACMEAEERVRVLDEQLQRLNTYYEAPASTKWKVLAAYLGLALVLSAFLLYGNDIMRYYQPLIG